MGDIMVSLDQKKNKILYLIEIFEKYTDEEHRLTLEEITKHLANLGIDVERKTLYKDIRTLDGFGYEILKSKDKTTRYYLNSRLFELAELKLLVDSVLSSRFITAKKSKQFINKLQTLTSSYKAEELNRNIVVENRIKSDNERILYITDGIHLAMAKNKRISFNYKEFYLDNGEVKSRIRKSGKRYTVDPLALEFQGENYYLIAHDHGEDCQKHFRADKIYEVKILETEISDDNRKESMDIAKHNKKTFNMFSGEEVTLTMRFHTDCLSGVVDKFGQNMSIIDSDDDTFTIEESVAISPTFYGWLVFFRDKVEILEPKDEKNKFIAHIESIVNKY